MCPTACSIPPNDGIREQLKVLTNETKRLKNMTKLSLEEFKRKTDEQRRKQQELLFQRGGGNQPTMSEASASQRGDHSSMQEEPPNETVVLDMQSKPIGADDKLQAKNEPASRGASPVDSQERESTVVTAQEAPSTWDRESRLPFGKYMSPLASLQNQRLVIDCHDARAIVPGNMSSNRLIIFTTPFFFLLVH